MLPEDLSKEELRQLLHQEQRRWHPDKFQQNFGKKIRETEREDIMSRVKLISQHINESYNVK